jgi:WhiB family transcriptional regulator, redox-sensing transcriptional regulator
VDRDRIVRETRCRSVSVQAAVAFSATSREWAWQRAAACGGMDIEVFFGVADEPSAIRIRREAAARTVCARCPVRRKCLRFAIDHKIRDGIWGGTHEDERAALASKLRRGENVRPG